MLHQRVFKILVVGSDGSGKGLILRHIAKLITEDSTKSIRIYKKSIVTENAQIAFHLWEWAADGDNPYLPKKEFFQGASGAFVFFDVRSAFSFDRAKIHLTVLQEKYAINPVILIGNFAEHVDSRVIEVSDGEELAAQQNCLYREVDTTKLIEFEDIMKVLINRVPLLHYA